MRSRASVSSLPDLLEDSNSPELSPSSAEFIRKREIRRSNSSVFAANLDPETEEFNGLNDPNKEGKWPNYMQSEGNVGDLLMNNLSEGSERESPQNKSNLGVPVFVMLPLDTISPNGELKHPRAVSMAMKALKSAGVTVSWGYFGGKNEGLLGFCGGCRGGIKPGFLYD